MVLTKVSGGDDIPDITNWTEENGPFVVHVEWAVQVKLCKGIVAFLNDIDEFIL